MRPRIFKILTVALFILAASVTSYGAKEVDEELKSDILQYLSDIDSEWEYASISGKFKMKGLPLSPSVKVYMERDSLVIISLRAPFVGEAGRCEITADSILLVNKMDKIYAKESLEYALRDYPLSLNDIQNLILGRIVMPGLDDFIDDEELIEIYEQEEEYAMLPVEDIYIGGISYGYLLYTDFRPKLLLIVPDENPDVNIMVSYEYLKKGYDMLLTYKDSFSTINAELQLDEPLYRQDKIDPIKLNSKYREISLIKFIQMF